MTYEGVHILNIKHFSQARQGSLKGWSRYAFFRILP